MIKSFSHIKRAFIEILIKTKQGSMEMGTFFQLVSFQTATIAAISIALITSVN